MLRRWTPTEERVERVLQYKYLQVSTAAYFHRLALKTQLWGGRGFEGRRGTGEGQ